MHCLVQFPTRTILESQSAIDNILTNIDRTQLSITGVITEISDHDAQLLEVNFLVEKYKQPVYHFKRKFNKANNDLFLKNIASETWYDLYQAPVEQKYDVFINTFNYYFDIFHF